MCSTCGRRLPLPPVADDIAPDTPLTSLSGDTRPLDEWTTTFHLALVVLDPFTYESAWILDTGGRILRTSPRPTAAPRSS